MYGQQGIWKITTFRVAAATIRLLITYIVSKRLLYSTDGPGGPAWAFWSLVYHTLRGQTNVTSDTIFDVLSYSKKLSCIIFLRRSSRFVLSFRTGFNSYHAKGLIPNVLSPKSLSAKFIIEIISITRWFYEIARAKHTWAWTITATTNVVHARTWQR